MVRGEFGNTFVELRNPACYALRVLYHVFSDSHIVANVRQQVSPLERAENDRGGIVDCIDLASIRESYPVLLSNFKESFSTAPRTLGHICCSEMCGQMNGQTDFFSRRVASLRSQYRFPCIESRC
ncbi:hypothetical protein GGS23DRAFT_581121 [Durotheca rogersii]|uniref:uncharacterized protein n=1 Tax=Durotheca rogersii TaxID=419775 RepID=UPI002220E84C|nr:uncharacterized protein GGS23DRAFT_581121 [Durotheca rogersii]KAI5860363.1 hypothetical protein GGS23DRAFT_581121 [Durotheca rogersii]